MKKKKGGRKTWRVSTLVRRALKSQNENSYWACVHELRWRGSLEVFQAAKSFCKSSKVRERSFGSDVLAQLGVNERPFRKETLAILHKMLKSETSSEVLNSVLVAISHSQESEDSRGTKVIADLRKHSSSNVRFGVVSALTGRTNSISVNALIELSRDKSPEVRDWATFGLGTMIELDTSAVRKALFERLGDKDCDTRCEALLGLALRKDQRVKTALIDELQKDNVTSLVFEAAEEFGDKDMLPLLERQIASAGETTDESWLQDAKDAKKNLESIK